MEIIGGEITNGVINAGIVGSGGSVTITGCAVGPGATIINGVPVADDEE